MTHITTKQAIARLKEFKLELATITIGLTVGFCAPPPAHAEPYNRDPFYTTYPFQTPAQASREMTVQSEQRRRERIYEDQRQEDRRWQEDQRRQEQLERDLREIYRGR